MKVTIDKYSGFCTGVARAIQTAENELNEAGQLYCLGDIVHNEQELKRLKTLGLEFISGEKFSEIKNTRVLIRAHGEPPTTYFQAKENNIELLDATCPVVRRIQEQIVRSVKEVPDVQIIIYGKADHPEVIGLAGQSDGKAIVVINENQLNELNYSRPIHVFSQTTMSPEGFDRISKVIKQNIDKINIQGIHDFKIFNTVCRQVSRRQPAIRKFATQHEVIIFVSGKESSNGKMLFKACSEVNTHTFFISDIDELQPQWFKGVKTVGVCGATSTPGWLLEKVKDAIEKIKSEK